MSTEAEQAAVAAAPQNEVTPNEERKPVQSIILDTGPLIKNDPPVSTLLSQADQLFTLPSVLDEIRDTATRTRVETTLLPFVKLRSPRSASIKFVTDFSRRTGDLEVMSRPDIHLLALAYEIEVEQNGGDWRLRSTPGQKSINGKPPGREAEPESADGQATAEIAPTEVPAEEVSAATTAEANETNADAPEESTEAGFQVVSRSKAAHPTKSAAEISDKMDKLDVKDDAPQETEQVPESQDHTPENAAVEEEGQEADEGADSDSDDGWITPSNLKKRQAKDRKEIMPTAEAVSLKVALLTSDFAMQNVALRIGLNLLSPAMSRITQVKNWVLRCHGCFQVCKKMDVQFCPKCGQPTLTRVSCTTGDDGSFQIHLKRNFQWNNRGNVYSIPKPVTGTSSGKIMGKNAGGKNGWGTKLMLSEDQKEYERAMGEKKRERKKDLMDEDYLPNILTGERTGGSGRVRLGPGRGVNGKKNRG